MNCETFTGLMVDYRENDLDSVTKDSFDRHRNICLNCMRLLNSYNEIIRIARSLPCADMPASMANRIRNEVRAKLDKQQS